MEAAVEGRRFNFFVYNLSENFLSPNDQSKFLRTSTSTLSILNEFRNPNVRKKIIDFKIPFHYGDEELGKEINKKWDKILAIVYDKVSKYDMPRTLVEDLTKIVTLLGRQIYELFWRINSHEERSLFFDYLTINNQGYINIRSTVSKILRESKKSDEWKFFFSCRHFAGEDTVTKFFYLLPKPIKIWYARTKHTGCTNLCIPVCFWLWHIGRTKNVFKDYVQESAMNNDSFVFEENYESVAVRFAFHQAFEKGHEIAVKFIFDNYISKSVEKNLILGEEIKNIKKIKFKFLFRNIIVYLISQMEENLPSWFLEFSEYIFKILFEDFRWHDIFVRIFRDTQDQLEEKAIEILQNSIDILIEKERDYANMYINTFKNFVDIFSPSTKIAIVISKEEIYYSKVRFALDENLDERITILLLSIANGVKTHTSKDFMKLDINKNSMWPVPISNCSTEYLDSIFKQFLIEEEDSIMRHWLFNKHGYDAIRHFIVTYRLDHLETFLNWSSNCHNEMSLRSLKDTMIRDYFNFIIGKVLFCDNLYHLHLFNGNEHVKTKREYKDCTIDYTEKVLKWILIDDRFVSFYKEKIRRGLFGVFYLSLRNWVVALKFQEVEKLFEYLNVSYLSIREIKEKMWKDSGLYTGFCKDDSHTDVMEFAEWYYLANLHKAKLTKKMARMSRRIVIFL